MIVSEKKGKIDASFYFCILHLKDILNAETKEVRDA